MKTHLAKLFFSSIFPVIILFFLFHFYRSYQSFTFSFSQAATNPCYSSQICDGSVYHIDVDVDDNQVQSVSFSCREVH